MMEFVWLLINQQNINSVIQPLIDVFPTKPESYPQIRMYRNKKHTQNFITLYKNRNVKKER